MAIVLQLRFCPLSLSLISKCTVSLKAHFTMHIHPSIHPCIHTYAVGSMWTRGEMWLEHQEEGQAIDSVESLIGGLSFLTFTLSLLLRTIWILYSIGSALTVSTCTRRSRGVSVISPPTHGKSWTKKQYSKLL